MLGFYDPYYFSYNFYCFPLIFESGSTSVGRDGSASAVTLWLDLPLSEGQRGAGRGLASPLAQ